MGTNTITAAVAGTKIASADHNSLRTAMLGDLVPRNSSSGAADSLEGTLGTDTYQWLKAFISSGYWSPGDIKSHVSYNGTVGPGQGWMLCDGRVINEANYNTEHGAGSWDTYVGTSLLDNKYLPDLTDKYLVGAETTPQTGASAITSVGNDGNEIDISHVHISAAHVHLWSSSLGATQRSHDSDGLLVNMSQAVGTKTGIEIKSNVGTNMADIEDGVGSFTGLGGGVNTSEALVDPVSIQPDSIEVQFYMRVI